ncbi:MAG: hypothetical protein KF911_08235 [Pseudomonadales bacterium]|nr:hypothetical protein [Pseudomonadales bacterium]
MSFLDPVLVIDHRGAAGLVPENTLPSFQRAFECAVGAVELDVYALEGELLVIHDDTLERTTNGSGSRGHGNWACAPSSTPSTSWPKPVRWWASARAGCSPTIRTGSRLPCCKRPRVARQASQGLALSPDVRGVRSPRSGENGRR